MEKTKFLSIPELDLVNLTSYRSCSVGDFLMSQKTGEKKLAMSRVLYIQYTNPAIYPPLEHSSRILAEDEWEILFLGTGAQGTADALCFPPHPNITVRQMPFCPAGWRQKLHYVQFGLWVIIWSLCWRSQWVYASDFLACPIAMLLSFLPGVRVIYHEHDSPATAVDSLFLRLCMLARKCLAHRADMCILPNQERAECFVSDMGNSNKVFCVWNCPAQEEVSPPRPPYNDDNLWILYHGSIVPARIPLTVLSALATLPKIFKLRVIGYETIGHSGYVQQLQEMAFQLGIGERVELITAVPRNELLGWCKTCDIGLAFMPGNSNDINLKHMMGASNKAFDYLACGLALLVSDLPDWKQMYVEPGYGLACHPDAPASIAAALRWYLDHPAEMREMGDRGRQRILTEWNYETQFQPVKHYMSKAFF